MTIDLVGRSARSEGAVFELLDKDLVYQGVLTPALTVQVQNDSTAAIKRRLQSFVLPPGTAADVDPLSSRVAAYWKFGDGTRYQLGVFMWADASNRRSSSGVWMPSTLVDQGLILSQRLDRTVGFGVGDSVVSSLQNVCDQLGFVNAQIDGGDAVLGAPIAFSPSNASWSDVLTALARLGGYLDPYFTNAGVLRIRVPDDLSAYAATLIYEHGCRVYSDTMIESNDLLNAPNLYVVADTSATATGVIARWEIPSSAPHSIVNRGFVVPRFIDAPGVADLDSANALAEAAYHQDPLAYETVEFDAAVDPRHDTFDVVQYRGKLYTEQAWTLTCSAGGPHHHKLKRVFT